MDNIDALSNEPIKATDLDFYTLLRRQANEGRVFFNQRRAVIFDTEALGTLRQQLIDTLSEELAMGVLTRFGYAHGNSDAKTLGENFDWETETDWLAAGPSIHTLEGIVHITPEKIEFDRETGHFHMHGIWLNSYEAEEHLKRYGPSDHPVCWTLTGYASGYTSGFFGHELLAIETECVGQGDDRCYWEIRPVAEWGPEAEPYLKALEQIDLSGQLFAANQQLQTQTEQLALLNEMSTKLNEAADLEAIFKIAAQKTRQIINVDQASIALLKPAGNTFALFALDDTSEATPQGSELPLDKTTGIGRAIKSKQVIISDNIQTNKVPENKDLAAHGFHTAMVAPLISGGRIIGTLNVASKTANLYNEQSKEIIAQVASFLGSAIENQQLIEQTRQRAAEFEETTDFLDSILETIPLMVFVKDAEDLRFVRWNKAGEELVGFKREELMGKNDYDFFSKKEADFFTAKDREVLAGGQLVDIPEEPIQTAGGEIRLLHTKKIPILGSDGKPRYLLGISEDITERKQQGDELRKLSQAVEQSSSTVVITSIDGYIEYANPRFVETTGYTLEEAIGQHTRVLKSGETSAEEYKQLWETIATGGNWHGEFHNRKKNGELYWEFASISPIRNEAGVITHFLAVKDDITERKQAEKLLQESQKLYQSTIDGLPQNIYRIDREGRVIFGNKTYLETIGMTFEECLGKTAYDFFPKELADKYTVDDNWVMETGQTLDVVEKHIVPDTGETSYVRVVKVSVWDDAGNVTGLQGGFWDITQRIHSEQALAKRAAELETVAHIGAMLSTVLNSKELIQTVVDVANERFDLYHTHIYLLDDDENTLNLAASAGEAGRQMVTDGWSIPLTQEQSHVAQAARTRSGVKIGDVRKSPNWLPNPLVPNTRAELAIPILIGSQVVGVYDVQCENVNRFTQDDVHIQTVMASQIAVALENARLFEESQKATSLLGERVKELDCLNDIGREMEEAPPIPKLLQWVTERIPPTMQYPDLCEVGIEFDGQVYGIAEAIKLPAQITHGLYIGGKVQGRVYIAYTEKHDFLDGESALLGGIATRLSSYIENTLLSIQTQHQVEREQLINSISQKIQNTTTVENALQTVAQELGQAFQAHQTRIKLGTNEKTDPPKN